MPEALVQAVLECEEYETKCSCCGRPIYWGYGWLESSSKSLAAYWYQWSEGHQGRFYLAIARFDEKEYLVPGVVCISAEVGTEKISYSILEPRDAPWNEFGKFGVAVDRVQVLQDRENIFALVDAIAANESRISSRILACRLHA
jgi:hypothetical protein